MSDPSSPLVAPDVLDRVAAELEDGEKLVWAGQPRVDLMVRKAYFLVPFGVVFTGFSAVWIVVALVLTAGLLAPCGLPFAAIGIGMILSPIWLRSMARKTVYLLTDRRAIVFHPRIFGRTTVQSFTAAGLGQMARSERSDGSGDLIFEEFRTGSGDSARTEQRGFLAVDDVKRVEELIRQTLLTS